jgi:uncharacterized membrane protein
VNVLVFVSLVVVGFVACAEFGSYAFVHPVLRRLPAEHHIAVEQGLLRTFGRVMPVGMTLSPVLAASTAASGTTTSWLATGSTICLGVALVTTIAVNVGINRDTGTWDTEQPPDNWRQTRRRWELFQGIRSWLLLVGFALLAAAVTT